MLLFAALLLAQAAPCPPFDSSTLGPFAAWPAHFDSLRPGTAVTLTAGDPARLTTLPKNDRKGGAVLVAFNIATAGPYEIAIDQPGWIDLLTGFAGVTPLDPVSHRHGPDCSPIRKILRFELKPGTYRLYISGLAKPAVRVMLVAGE